MIPGGCRVKPSGEVRIPFSWFSLFSAGNLKPIESDLKISARITMPGKKKFECDPKELVIDSLEGLTYLNPQIEYDPTYQIISLKELSKDRCHLICGGGSGHEPSHAGFVGSGMLSAAVCGNIFASPNSQQVTNGLQKLENGKGILIVVMNYTGDVLNFGIAKERWTARRNTDAIKMVVVGDDVSVGKEQGKLAGRRGLAGTVLVYKIAGALAAQGAPLSHVHAVAQFVADHSATIGAGFDHCQIPGAQASKEHDNLGSDEIDIGMGIHNEPGYKRQKITNLSQLISDLMPVLTSTTDKDRSFLPFRTQGSSNKEVSNDVILLINNLGSISELEMCAIVKSTGTWLLEKGFQVKRVISGTLMTSLDMSGFSISLVLLPPANEDVTIEIAGEPTLSISANMLLDLFDAPADCPGWKPGYAGQPSFSKVEKKDTKALVQEPAGGEQKPTEETVTVNDPALFIKAVQSACQALISAEPEITKYDTIAGDGDCGLTLKSGAEGILAAISQEKIKGTNLISDLLQISEVVNRDMGGTSGGLYSIYFNALAVGIGKAKPSKSIGSQTWADALDYALNTLYKYTRARSPSRTLIDPLSAFVLTFTLTPTEFDKAIEAAKESAENTIYLDAKAGRASYVDRQKLQDSQVPDAGAWGVWKLLEAIGQVIN
ncbi:Dihydroxyacetone kinase 2 [Puccinia graminis f. sp. tritici]|uniref:Dihydroxyacetone kinase 2 n=1 Tax=Puccinia graminis f. sp. tritici TaxID=56615 RepID=A0A5B0MEH4_PUCGR|nr:Dihydroxyacetone kinase 2 [Puccinia graminis f. sp. tritici]